MGARRPKWLASAIARVNAFQLCADQVGAPDIDILIDNETERRSTLSLGERNRRRRNHAGSRVDRRDILKPNNAMQRVDLVLLSHPKAPGNLEGNWHGGNHSEPGIGVSI